MRLPRISMYHKLELPHQNPDTAAFMKLLSGPTLRLRVWRIRWLKIDLLIGFKTTK